MFGTLGRTPGSPDCRAAAPKSKAMTPRPITTPGHHVEQRGGKPSGAARAGMQAIGTFTNCIDLRTSRLAPHVMRPGLNGQSPNLPANQKAFDRIPRSPPVPTARTQSGLGTIENFVDRVAMFDSRDGLVWTGAAEAEVKSRRAEPVGSARRKLHGMAPSTNQPPTSFRASSASAVER